MVDLCIRGASILTMDPEARILPEADLWVDSGRIVGLGVFDERESGAARQVVEACGKWLLPGFVQAHVHLCQTLFRNQAEDLPLLEWLESRIWPFEAAHDEESMRASARLGMVEMIRGGTTAALDMGTAIYTDVIFSAADEIGFRLTTGMAHMDSGDALPTRLKQSTRDSLREAEALCKQWHGRAEDRLQYAFAPRFVLSCTDGLLESVGACARERGARLHTHASENRAECAAVRQRFGQENIEVLDHFGLLGADVVLAHGIWLGERERELLKDSGSHVVHCPSTNLKLGSGLARVPELLDAGISVALSADGAPCNNTLDALQEMRLAALLHKPRCGPAAMPARQVLEMATLGGARALGRENELGSIEIGKRADLILLDLDKAHTTPPGEDPYTQVVYCARASDVSDVWIDGRRVLEQGELLGLDQVALLDDARIQARRAISRAAG